MGLRVCYVVNSVSETSVPATIATGVIENTEYHVDLLAWFEAAPFDGDDRVGVHCLNAPRTPFGINVSTYRRARELLRKYDVIQANTNHAGTFAKLIGYDLGIPLVSREGNTRDGFSRKGRVANGLTNGLADRIVPNSQAVYDSFTRWERLFVDDERFRIIPNGVDLGRIDRATQGNYNLREQFGIPMGAVIVGTISVMSKQKNLETLIEGVFRANDQLSRRIDLVAVGDGPRRESLEELAATLGLEEQVHFPGMLDRDTVYRILGEIDIYSMPSRWEGFSNAAVEALGARNACVFSDIDSFTQPYKDVALFHPVNDEAELAARIIQLTENPALRETLGQKGRRLIKERYTLDEVAREYAALYSELV